MSSQDYDAHNYKVCEPCQTAFEPAVTVDSDTAVIIRYLYRGKIIRNGGRYPYDKFCVGGALCNYFDKYIDWDKTSAGLRQGFPHTDTLTDALEQIILNATAPADNPTVKRNDCKYYASALIEENDTGNYDKAWELVEEFCEEYSL